MSALEGDMKANSLDYKKAVTEILTAEQNAKFIELAQKDVAEKKESMSGKKEMMKEKKGKADKKDKKDKKVKKK